MRLSPRLIPLLLVIAGSAAPPAAAAPSMSATTKVYDITIYGQHNVNWAYTTSLDRKDCSTWTLGSGKLRTRFASDGKARYQLTEIRKGGRLAELQWGATRYRSLDFEIRQPGEWKYNNGFRLACTPCGQLSEYGPCVPDPPLQPAPTCRERKANGVIDTKIFREVRREKELEDVMPAKLHGAGLLVEMRYVDTDKQAIAGCYPFAGGEAQPLPQPAALVVGVERLRDLRRGKSVSLEVHRFEYVKSGVLQDGARCGPLKEQLKMNGCAATQLVLDAKRVR